MLLSGRTLALEANSLQGDTRVKNLYYDIISASCHSVTSLREYHSSSFHPKIIDTKALILPKKKNLIGLVKRQRITVISPVQQNAPWGE